MGKVEAVPGDSRGREPRLVIVRAPMKLVLAGEYAVLEKGAPGVVAAVNRYVTVTATRAPEGLEILAPSLGADALRSLEGPRPDGAVGFPEGEAAEKLVFARIAASIGYRYAAEMGLPPRPLSLLCESDGGQVTLPETGETRKIGLGSSAAACVAVLGAVLAAHGVPIDRPVYRRHLVRLALIAHTRGQGGRGSGIDVAAAGLGGILDFARPDPAWYERHQHLREGALEPARAEAPSLHVEPLPRPTGLRLLAGFTGASASTREMIDRIDAWKRTRESEHESFLRLSQRATKGLASALKKGAREEAIGFLRIARKALLFLEERAGVTLETPALKRLAEAAQAAGAAGKLSGAGGGDCGIALCFDEETATRIDAAWREAGITPIPLEVADGGLQEAAP